jgi:SusD family.
MKKTYKTLLKPMMAVTAMTVAFTSCVNDLDTLPLDENIQTENNVLTSDSSYLQLLAKCYAGFAVGGQTANDGNADISSIGGGYSSYYRQYWNAQELTTDEAICAWDDGNLRDYHDQDWNSSNELVTALYSRITLEISYCNNLIRLTKGKDQYKEYATEARFLRAMSYWHLLDLYGTGPFVTEDDAVGFYFPKQASAQDLFSYIESELKDIEEVLPLPRANEYGRVDRAAAWMILAKLYLNAKVYIGTEMNTECITYCNKVLSAGYTLETKYANLFLADNNLRTNEIILPICFDGRNTQTWGGCTYLICASVGDGMNASEFGIGGGWGGNRTTSAFVAKFPDITGATDKRAMFYTNNHTLEIDNIFTFRQGYGLGKYKNVTSTGAVGSSTTFPDTDVPLLRVADAYLMYAEAVLRGGTGGTRAQALSYVNQVRERAYQTYAGDPAADISDSQLTLDFILDERARELYWEGQRRTDLIRFGKFTGGSYIWPWKGAVKEGKSTDAKYNLMPIPSSDINANPNLKQTALWQ